ncbi:MAG: nitrilase-related carbon-nitrogen hydrolase, partial [Acidobacteriota bacterium]
LATITNDAWFGRSAAPSQHFAMAVMRAAEMRRWLVRAANTGISGIITPDGEVVARTELFETGLLSGVIHPRHDLTWTARHPHFVPGGCVMILAVVVVAGRLRRPRCPSTA